MAATSRTGWQKKSEEEGAEGGGDGEEESVDVGVVETEEVEGEEDFIVVVMGMEREGDGREVMEGEGWEGGFDALDVGRGGACVEWGWGEEVL